MSDKVFFDTNLLVYSISTEGEKTAIAEALIASGGVISVQVLNEFVNIARKKRKMDWNEIHTELAVFSSVLRVVPLTIEIHERELWLTQNHIFALYDSMIVAAAELAGCSILYTEDMNAGFVTGGLTLVNPFKAL